MWCFPAKLAGNPQFVVDHFVCQKLSQFLSSFWVEFLFQEILNFCEFFLIYIYYWMKGTHTSYIQQKMSMVLQVLEIFEIWIYHILDFYGCQKRTSIVTSSQNITMDMSLRVEYIVIM